MITEVTLISKEPAQRHLGPVAIGEFLDAVQVSYLYWSGERYGAVAQLGERLLCKEEVRGSSPLSSTNLDFSTPRP